MRPKRLTRAAAAAAVWLSVVSPGGPAPAANARPTVAAGDFPRVGEVAAIVPAFAGGTRTVEADHPIWIFKSNCSSYEDGPSGEIRKWAYYYPAEDGPVLWVHVQEFANRHDAMQAILVIRSNSEGCYGTHHIGVTNATLIRRAADVPALGDGRPVAWKMNDHWTDQDTGTHRVEFSRRIWMREGETVIGVNLWAEEPQTRRVSVRLARLALRSVD